ncbi:hypothetical protein BpHYR1_001791, partial [Brachionus plicatilis]
SNIEKKTSESPFIISSKYFDFTDFIILYIIKNKTFTNNLFDLKAFKQPNLKKYNHYLFSREFFQIIHSTLINKDENNPIESYIKFINQQTNLWSNKKIGRKIKQGCWDNRILKIVCSIFERGDMPCPEI